MNLNKISLELVPRGTINNIPALVQIMVWRWPGPKPLYRPMIVSLLMHIYVTQPQWVNTESGVGKWGVNQYRAWISNHVSTWFSGWGTHMILYYSLGFKNLYGAQLPIWTHPDMGIMLMIRRTSSSMELKQWKQCFWGKLGTDLLCLLGPLLLTCGLTLIPAWISNYIHYNVWDEITYPFLNFNGATVEV